MPVNILLVTVSCLGLVQTHHFQAQFVARLQSGRRQQRCTVDMLIPRAALTQTHPDLFSTMSTVLILLLTPMRRILVCYEMELDSCHTDIQLLRLTFKAISGVGGKKSMTFVLSRKSTKTLSE